MVGLRSCVKGVGSVGGEQHRGASLGEDGHRDVVYGRQVFTGV
ncbi:hypothetical protein RSSM_06280 [Rhodopirellula sallentina SM41]|uniref:Uncharacterized protein n=1 Tax=Rhodopirellula sallentina SM41 TaxID=1263870 RepID=M5TSW8_9BACT|nr:hypothetical protein RSSM_06280 [Rhodopirellula sallentina SM41]